MVLIALGLLPLFLSCDSKSTTPARARAGRAPRLVVLFATCTVKKDLLEPYDAAIPFTPSLAAFARESWVFARHTTEAEQSGPAFASIFSGAQADRHGVFHHPAHLDERLHLIAEAFAAGGFETWFWSGHPMASARLKYGQGVPPERVQQHGVAERGRITAEEALGLTANDAAFDRLLDRLQHEDDLHSFVMINSTLTHGPYSYYSTPAARASFCERFPNEAGGMTPQEIEPFLRVYEKEHLDLSWNHAATFQRLGYSEREVQKLATAVEVAYKTALFELDRLFGLLVERIRARGLWDESLVAFTADHGELLYRDNALFLWTHGLQLAPESLDVPWIVHVPGAHAEARRYENVTRSIDVFPTLAGLCGIELPENAGIEGVDLAPVMRGESPAPKLVAFSHTTTLNKSLDRQMQAFPPVTRFFSGTDVNRMWVRARDGDLVYKLRNLDGKEWGVEVFDLATDPEERRNLYTAEDPEHRAMAEKLAEYKARLVAAHGRLKDGRDVPEAEELQRLRALGYVK